MEDPFFDGLGKRYLAHLFFSARTISLEASIGFTAIWAYKGWDSTVFSSYGVGVHWSSLQTFAVFFYLLVVNLQVGGFHSFRQIGHEVRRDLLSCGRELSYVLEGRISKYKALRNEYKAYPSVDGLRAVSFAFFFASAGMFGFENIWVLLYDHFQFGTWFWPIYYFQSTPLGTPLLNGIFLKNFLILAVGLFFGFAMLYAASDGEKGSLRARFLVGWRFDIKWLSMIFLTALAWGFWIVMPHVGFTLTYSDIISTANLTQSAFESTKWIFPQANWFPQTEYTFYSAVYHLEVYPPKATFGYYVDDWTVHLVNVATKYLMFAAICYPAMVKVTLNKLQKKE